MPCDQRIAEHRGNMQGKNVPHKGDSTWPVKNVSLTEKTRSISDCFSHNTL